MLVSELLLSRARVLIYTSYTLGLPDRLALFWEAHRRHSQLGRGVCRRLELLNLAQRWSTRSDGETQSRRFAGLLPAVVCPAIPLTR
jgi:hypothetical protein